tara:strand:- start:522 stop:935 length:414 start_codon:yes stop_codon:yes gene_type:complete
MKTTGTKVKRRETIVKEYLVKANGVTSEWITTFPALQKEMNRLRDSGVDLHKVMVQHFHDKKLKETIRYNLILSEWKKSDLTQWEIRAIIADSGKTSMRDMLAYLKAHHNGYYCNDIAKENAREMANEIKIEMRKYR